MVKHAGGTTNYWLYDVPEAHIIAILQQIARDHRAAEPGGGVANPALLRAVAAYCTLRDRLLSPRAAAP